MQVCVGAFVYLGFTAAGEEIEQPFGTFLSLVSWRLHLLIMVLIAGYEDNDLDLDMFCREIIRQDIQCLKKARCLNAWFPPAPAPAAPAASTSGANVNVLLVPGSDGNMHRASLASLSDAAGSIEEEVDVEEGDAETPTEEGEAQGDGEGDGRENRNAGAGAGGAREGQLVDV